MKVLGEDPTLREKSVLHYLCGTSAVLLLLLLLTFDSVLPALNGVLLSLVPNNNKTNK